jgi:hypothetical protein
MGEAGLSLAYNAKAKECASAFLPLHKSRFMTHESTPPQRFGSGQAVKRLEDDALLTG